MRLGLTISPSRYPHTRALVLCSVEMMSDNISPISIPVIDFSPWTDNTGKDQQYDVSAQLIKACQEFGFAYIVNHGVPQDTLDHAFGISRSLYYLPHEEKMQAPHPPGWAHHRGYSWPGLEKVSAAQTKEEDQALIDTLRATTDCKVTITS